MQVIDNEKILPMQTKQCVVYIALVLELTYRTPCTVLKAQAYSHVCKLGNTSFIHTGNPKWVNFTV